MIPMVALTASLSANATVACCTEADPAEGREPATAYERETGRADASGPGPAPPADAWRRTSPAENEARALAAREGAAPVSSHVQRLALSALAEHAARAMGAESATVLGLDAIAPPIAVGEVPRSALVGAARHTPAIVGKPVEAAASRLTGGMRRVARAPTPFDVLIEEAANQHAVSADLVRAVVKVESNFQPHARSPKGAIGLMQVMPATGRRFGAVDLHDPRTNIQAGTRYLRWLLTRFGEDLTLALAAYNAGEGAVEKHGRKVPPYAETRDYVGKVLRYLSGSDGAAATTRDATAGGAPAFTASTSPSPSPVSSQPSAAAPSQRAVAQRGNGSLQTVATWMGALLTSAYRPRSTGALAGADTVPTATGHGNGVRIADAFSPGPR
jgi:soluble lytic murein transglycosylase-like protein